VLWRQKKKQQIKLQKHEIAKFGAISQVIFYVILSGGTATIEV